MSVSIARFRETMTPLMRSCFWWSAKICVFKFHLKRSDSTGGLDSVFGWLVVMHARLYYLPFSLSLSRWWLWPLVMSSCLSISICNSGEWAAAALSAAGNICMIEAQWQPKCRTSTDNSITRSRMGRLAPADITEWITALIRAEKKMRLC